MVGFLTWTLSGSFAFPFLRGTREAFAFILAFSIVIPVIRMGRVASSLSFAVIVVWTPPVCNSGRVVGNGRLFVVAHEFGYLELRVAGKTFECVEFHEFVECEGPCNV